MEDLQSLGMVSFKQHPKCACTHQQAYSWMAAAYSLCCRGDLRRRPKAVNDDTQIPSLIPASHTPRDTIEFRTV